MNKNDKISLAPDVQFGKDSEELCSVPFSPAGTCSFIHVHMCVGVDAGMTWGCLSLFPDGPSLVLPLYWLL